MVNYLKLMIFMTGCVVLSTYIIVVLCHTVSYVYKKLINKFNKNG